MQEKTLLKLSLITSTAGICLLFFLSTQINNEEESFQLINNGDFTTINGRITEVNSRGNVTFLSIDQTKTITAIVFEDYVNFKKGDFVELRGNVKNYKGTKELIVEEIRLY